MINEHRDTRLFGGGNHAIGFGQRGCDRLFAEDSSNSRLGGINHDLGMRVVAGDDTDDVQILRGQHFAMVAVYAEIRQNVRPLLLEVRASFGPEVAARDEFRFPDPVVGTGVGNRQMHAHPRVLGPLRQPCGNAGQANDAGPQLAGHIVPK